MAEIDELRQKVAILEKQYADVIGDGSIYRKLQVDLDAALQKHKDDAAAHSAVIASLKADNAKAVENLTANCIARLKEQADQHEQAIANLKASHEAAIKGQADQLNLEHAAVIADLKERFLIPAQRDLQARQLADLQKKHADDIAALQS